MNIPRVLLSLAAVTCLFASCKDVSRDFAPSAGGAGKGGDATNQGGKAGNSAFGGRGGAPASGGAGGVNEGGTGADAGSSGEAGSGGEAGFGGEAGSGTGCTITERRCRGDVPEACGADGTWEATQAGCAFGCLDGACSDCADGVKACDSGQAKTCVDGQWQFSVCDSQCEAGECVDACTEGSRQCDGLSKVQVCTAGVFVADTDCAGICADGKCVGACKPDATRCRPDSTTTPELCSSQGQWVAATCSGTTTACLEGACVACTPTAKRCSTTGAPQQCSEFGSWVDQSPCGGDAPACVEGECRTCEPNARRCSAGLPQQCNALGTAWVDGTACSGATPACVASSGTCGTCRVAERQCGSDTTPQACDANGRWVDEPKCATAAPVCLVGQCVACQPNERRCSGTTQPQLCSANGQWVNDPACAGTTPSCIPATGSCGCTEGAQKCLDGNTPELCSAAGSWVAQSDCRGDTPACVGGACQCQEGERECTAAATGRVCTNGVWENVTCPTEAPVCAAGKCVVCAPGSVRCSLGGTHIVEVCSTDGVWKESTQCADFCSRAQCVTPATDPGTLGCDAATGLLCKAPNCCFAGKGTSYCEDPRTACGAKTIPMECDGPSDCLKATPICCASATGIGCVALAADCSRVTGQPVCDPADPVCPARTTCTRFTANLFTCQ